MVEILIKTSFSPQSEPHRAKLCYSVVLKHYWGNSQRTSLFSQKKQSQKETQKYTESLFVLTCLKIGKSLGEFGFI